MVSLSLAQKNVIRKQERSLLTIIGVILAVGSFVALLSVAEGLYQKLYREVYGRNIDIYILPPSTLPLPTGPIGALGYSADEIRIMESLPVKPLTAPLPPDKMKSLERKVENIITYLTPSDTAESSTKIQNIKKAIGVTRFQQTINGKSVILWGIPYDQNDIGEENFLKTFFPNVTVADGLLPTPEGPPDDPYCLEGVRKLEELTEDEKKIIIGTKLSQDLRLPCDREFSIKRGQNTVNLKVGTVARFQVGFQDYFCFMPVETALTLEDSPGKVKEIWIQVQDKKLVKETKRQLQLNLPDLSVKTSEEYLGASSELVRYAWLLQFAIALIGILIATTASMNTMLMSTFERIKEFGALRAIGTSRFTIIMMILIESLILSITGGIFGIVVGLLGSKFLDGAVMSIFQTSFPLAHITVNLIIYALVLSLSIGIVGALIPAIIVYRMDVIQALRGE
ncbi:MAG: ABC transporter permease [Candidatus Eremiobacteraeota bacterium]|nr:ABC transporter permease [Candidatus Eremiobacteraeota bacterium]